MARRAPHDREGMTERGGNRVTATSVDFEVPTVVRSHTELVPEGCRQAYQTEKEKEFIANAEERRVQGDDHRP